MNKIKLLSKSHFKKNRGTSIGLVVLMMIACMLLSSSLLLFFDAYPAAQKEVERLDACDGFIRIDKSLEGIDDDVLDGLLKDDCERYDIRHALSYHDTPVPFAEGKITVNVVVDDGSAFDKDLGRTEIVTEDSSISDDYIYLPYQFYTSGNYKLGDDYNVEIFGKQYDLKVKGFTTTPYFGCNNNGTFEFIVDDGTYGVMKDADAGECSCITVIYDLKEGVKGSKFAIEFNDKIVALNGDAVVSTQSIGNILTNRTFMSRIIAVSFLVITIVLILVILMMLVNSITNYIRENMKTLGALKAVGYTSRDIKSSLLLLFGFLSVIGSLIGLASSYGIMPLVASFAIAQMGIPYTPSFNLLTSVISVVSVVIFTVIITMFAVRKIRKIEPIVALRNGTESHNFRKNRFALKDSSFGLNFNLAMKTMVFNMKQNVITFLVIGLIMFLCTIALLMYNNFNREPKLELLTFETCGGVVVVDHEARKECLEYMEDREDVINPREIYETAMTYNGEDRLNVYICGDTDKLVNRSACYEGRYPTYDNEITISGKFAKEYGFNIGDEIELRYGEETYSYLITGFMQTTNNDGREAIMNMAGAGHVMDLDYIPGSIWYDCDSKEASESILDGCADRFGDHVISRNNFYETVEGGLSTFKGLATAMLVFMSLISASLILLVLFLLIKSLIFSKRLDYGIYKALGYTNNDLMIQTALSFMPSIILSVIIFAVISYHIANPYMNMMMTSFGVVRANFTIPVAGMLIISASVIVLSFLFALFEARKIRKIEAYNMLIAE